MHFYEQVFGMEKIPTYDFGFPVRYLRLGDLQPHISKREDTDAPTYHHFGMDADDLEAVSSKARGLGIHDQDASFSEAYELPDGSVRMYLRDLGVNLVEVDRPDLGTLGRSALPETEEPDDRVLQVGEAPQATLYFGSRRDEVASEGTARPRDVRR